MRFYSIQLRQYVEVMDSEVKIMTMKSGKKAAQAVIKKNGKTVTVFKILSEKGA